MNGEAVGTWSWLPDGEELRYADSWLASPRGRPLSLSLPFQPQNRPLKSAAVQRWFENLLPDSKTIRERIARRFGAASISAIDLLAEIGRDCVGALQIVPDGEDPDEIRKIDGVELNDSEVAEELAACLGGAGSPASALERRRETPRSGKSGGGDDRPARRSDPPSRRGDRGRVAG